MRYRVSRDERTPADGVRAYRRRAGSAHQRRRPLEHHGGRVRRHRGDHPDRRAARRPAAGRSRQHAGRPRGDLLPARRGLRLDLGSRPAAPDGRGAWRGGPRDGRGGAARPWRQPQAQPARRPQLRVLLRGPAAGRRPRGAVGARPAKPRRRRMRQALRGQQPGDRADADQRGGRRAHAARTVPARLPAGGDPGPAVDDHGRLQQGQRRVRHRAPLAAHAGAAR